MTRILRTLTAAFVASLIWCPGLFAQNWDPIVTVGSGYVDNSSRQVVRTPNGVVYFVTNGSPVSDGPSFVAVYKGSPAGSPTSFAEQDAVDRPTDPTRIGGVDCRLGGDGLIKIIYQANGNGNARYVTFDTTTDQWGTSEVIAGMNGQPPNRFRSRIALAIDSNQVPHVIYPNSNNNGGLTYANRVVGGTWGSRTDLTTATAFEHPSLMFDTTGSLHLAYYNINTGDIFYRNRSAAGVWSTQETVASGQLESVDQGPTVAVDSANTPWIAYVGPSPDDLYHLKKRTGANTYMSVDPPNAAGHAPSIIFDAADNIYAFEGHDISVIQPFVQVRRNSDSAWLAYTQLASGPPVRDGGSSPRMDPLWPGSQSDIDTTALDETGGLFGVSYYVHGVPLGSGAGAAAVDLSPTSVNFGSQPVGTTSAPRTVTLTNSGGAPLLITSIAVSGPDSGAFPESNTCPMSPAALASAGQCAITLTFRPAAVGAAASTLSVSDSAAGSPHTVPLAGTGSDFSISLSPATATILAGGATSFVLSITPAGGFAQPVALSCSGAPSKATCSVSPGTLTPNGNSAVEATVTITTMARSLNLGLWPLTLRTLPFWPVPLAGMCALLVMASLRGKAATLRVRACFSAAWVLALVMLCSSCGGVSSPPGGGATGTPAGTYTITLTAISSGLSHTATFSLTVN